MSGRHHVGREHSDTRSAAAESADNARKDRKTRRRAADDKNDNNTHGTSRNHHTQNLFTYFNQSIVQTNSNNSRPGHRPRVCRPRPQITLLLHGRTAADCDCESPKRFNIQGVTTYLQYCSRLRDSGNVPVCSLEYTSFPFTYTSNDPARPTNPWIGSTTPACRSSVSRAR